MSSTLDLALELISRPSITPNDAECQVLLAQRLEALGFHTESMVFGEVTNLWARHGSERPVLVYAGHTDVVPPGPLRAWTYPPFEPQIEAGCLYGRGAADMKGSLAAMITACERFIARHRRHRGSLGFLITSDEEGPARDGTVKVVESLHARGEVIDCCLIGEPTSVNRVGDQIKNGRRGSLHGHLRVFGVQGHIAYPDRTVNPIHRFAPVLAELDATVWDEGNQYFPPTTFQVSNIRAGTGADNVIPGELEAHFNFRYSTAVTREELQTRVESMLTQHGVDYELSWTSGGEPFLTEGGALVDAVQDSVREICGIDTVLSTSGGTSDGRYVAPTGAEVVELGPLNGTIHRVNECVHLDDLDTLSRVYERVLEKLLLD